MKTYFFVVDITPGLALQSLLVKSITQEFWNIKDLNCTDIQKCKNRRLYRKELEERIEKVFIFHILNVNCND